MPRPPIVAPLSRRHVLKGAGAVIGASAGACDDRTIVWDPPGWACPGDSGLAPEELLSEIDTIVVVMMENRSFDHFFGSATFLEGAVFEGLRGDEHNPHPDGHDVDVFLLDNLEPADPPHDWDPSHRQWNDGALDGFVAEHHAIHPAVAHEVMGYHVREQLPVLYALMDEYVVCDRWFSSVLGPTWPNRLYLHAATADGITENASTYGLTTIWDLMADAGRPAKNYYSDLPLGAAALSQPEAEFLAPIDQFFDAAAAGTLPSYCVVDPTFALLPGQEGGNDDHPSHDITLGQVFLASIYEALAQSPQWSRCLLVIAYDEHGGFFDHVPPPSTHDEHPGFRQLGMRVPALVIGPHVRRGCADSTLYDHVSPIATATRRFGLPLLNARVSETRDLSAAIDPARLRDPRPPIALPRIEVSLERTLRRRGTSQPELASLFARGELPIPPDRRHLGAGRKLALWMLDRAQRLGVATIRP